jgi:hypothetical protein
MPGSCRGRAITVSRARPPDLRPFSRRAIDLPAILAEIFYYFLREIPALTATSMQ